MIVSGPTASPDSARVAQRDRNATVPMADRDTTTARLLIEHDTKYAGSFDAVYKAEGTELK